MSRVFVLLLCAILLSSLAACGEVPALPAGTTPRAKAAPGVSEEVLIGEENNGQQVTLSLGQVIEVSLPGNPTTGYSWGVVQVDQAILQQDSEIEYVPSSGALGAGGQQILRFKALQAGQTALVLEYRRSWEKEATPAETFSIQVTVR